MKHWNNLLAMVKATSLTLILFALSMCVTAHPVITDNSTRSVQNPQEKGVINTYEDSVKTRVEGMLNDPVMAGKLVEQSDVADMLDSLVNIKYFRDFYFSTDTNELNIYGFEKGEIPYYSDSVYQARIETLDAETPIELTYNKTVRNFIELYASKKRELTSRILGLSYLYFPMFEEYLDKYDIPLEMKYLAVVESALNPVAGSRAGAKGLWQFMYGTGKIYGLTVTSLVDDRFDPYKATDAACRHLNDLYDIYGDWMLVMAAYNSGAGNVNKAIRRAGGVKNYWAIWPYLPLETRGYVPSFIAAMYVMNYAPEHNLYPVHPGILYNGVDTVMVHNPIAFDQIAEKLQIPYEDVKYLNPAYKTGIIPVQGGKQYVLRLPKEYIGPFIANEQDIYTYKTQKGVAQDQLLSEIKKAQEYQIHIVRRGESLSTISRKYHLDVAQLKKWNNLRSNTIYPGQRLMVYPSSGSEAPVATKPSVKESSTEGQTATADEKMSHTVKKGETLGTIASKYGCTVMELKNWNNLKSNTIYPNQKLTLYGKTQVSSEATASETVDAERKIVTHTVRKGDTLWDIAKQYKGANIDEIKKLNNLSNSSKLFPGQKLKVGTDG
jgi:membrane-bound lytic murein transglycosylase D